LAEKTFNLTLKLIKLQKLPNDFIAVKTNDSVEKSRYGLFDVEYNQLMLIPLSEMQLWRDLKKKPSKIVHYEPESNGIDSTKWKEEFQEPLSAKGSVTTEAFESLLEIYRMETVDDIDDPDQVESDPYQYENNYIQQLYDQYYSTEPKQDPKKIFVVKDDMPESLQKRIREIVAKLSLKTKTSKVAGNDVIIDDSNFAQYVKRYTDLIRGAGKNTKIESIRYASVFGKLTENLNRVLVEGMQEIPELEAAIDDAVEYRRLSPQNTQYWEQLKQYHTDVKKQTKQNKQKSAEKIATPKSGNSSARYVYIPKHIANRIGYSTDGLVWGDRKYFVDRKISEPNSSYYIVTGDIGNQYKIKDVEYYSSENKFSKENLPRGGHAVTDWGKVDDFMKSLSLGAFQGNNNNIFFMPGAPIPKPTVPKLQPPPVPPVPLVAPGLRRPPALAAKPQGKIKIPAIAQAKPKASQIDIPTRIKKPTYVKPEEIKVKRVPPKPIIIRPEEVDVPIPKPKIEPYKPVKLPPAEKPERKQLRQKPKAGERPLYKPVTAPDQRRLDVKPPEEEPLQFKTAEPEKLSSDRLQKQLRKAELPPVDQSVPRPSTTLPKITPGPVPPDSDLKLKKSVGPPVTDLSTPPTRPNVPPPVDIPEPKVGGLADLDNSRIKTDLVGKRKIPPPKMPELPIPEPIAVGQRTIVKRRSSAPVAKNLQQRVRNRVNRAIKKLKSFPAKVGQTLEEIARLLNTDVKELAALNTNYKPAKGGPVLLSPQAASNADYVKLPQQAVIPDEAIESLRQQADSADELAAKRAKNALRELEKIKITMETPSLAKAVGSNLDQYAKKITVIDQTLYNEINDIIRQGAQSGDYLPNIKPASPSDYKKVLRNTTGNDTLKAIKDSDIDRLEKFTAASADDYLEGSPRQYAALEKKFPKAKEALKKFGGKAARGLLGLWPQTIALELIFAQEAGTGEDLELRNYDIEELVKKLQDPTISKQDKIDLAKKIFSGERWANDEYLSGITDPAQPILRVADNSDGVDVVTPYNARSLTVLDLLYGTYKKLDLETLIEETESLAGRWDMQLAAHTTGALGASEDKELTDIMIQAAKRSKDDLDTRKFMENKIKELQETVKYLKTLLVHLPETRREAAERYFTNAVMLDWIAPSQQEDAVGPAEQTVDLKEETVTSLMDAIEKQDIKEIVKQLGKRAMEIYQGIPDATADTLQIDLRLGVGLKVYQEASNLLKKLYNEMANLPPDTSAKKRLAELQNQIKETQGALSSVARYSNEQDAEYSLEDQKEIIEDNLLVPVTNNKFKFNKDLFPQYLNKLALEYGVPANALYAVSMVESSGGKFLYGDQKIGGSYGAFQVLSTDNGSFADYKQDTGQEISKEQLAADPILATQIGAWYFAKMYRQTTRESQNNNWTTPAEIEFDNGETMKLEGVPADLVRAAVRHNGGPSAINSKTGEPTKDNSQYAKDFVKYYKQRINESYNKEFKNSLQSRLFERLQKEKQCETY